MEKTNSQIIDIWNICLRKKQVNQKFDIRSGSPRKYALLTQIGFSKSFVNSSYH